MGTADRCSPCEFPPVARGEHRFSARWADSPGVEPPFPPNGGSSIFRCSWSISRSPVKSHERRDLVRGWSGPEVLNPLDPGEDTLFGGRLCHPSRGAGLAESHALRTHGSEAHGRRWRTSPACRDDDAAVALCRPARTGCELRLSTLHRVPAAARQRLDEFGCGRPGGEG